jgi:hypothetical protein
LRRFVPYRGPCPGLRVADDLPRRLGHVARSAGPVLHAPAAAGPVRVRRRHNCWSSTRRRPQRPRPMAPSRPALRRPPRDRDRSDPRCLSVRFAQLTAAGDRPRHTLSSLACRQREHPD